LRPSAKISLGAKVYLEPTGADHCRANHDLPEVPEGAQLGLLLHLMRDAAFTVYAFRALV
jgi:hypothetical protein